MKTYNTGSKVQYGVYASLKDFDMCFVSADHEILKGRPGAQYFRIPSWLLVLAAPALGGLFVIAFPLLVIMMVIGGLVKMVYQTAHSSVEKNAHLMDLRWSPTATYLNRKSGKHEKDTKDAKEKCLRDDNDKK